MVASTMWTNLVKEEFEAMRDSRMGGAAHAGELETSVYLYLAPERVQMDKAEDHYGDASGVEGSKYIYADLTKGRGPMKLIKWASSSTPNGVSGAPTLARAEKGQGDAGCRRRPPGGVLQGVQGDDRPGAGGSSRSETATADPSQSRLMVSGDVSPRQVQLSLWQTISARDPSDRMRQSRQTTTPM